MTPNTGPIKFAVAGGAAMLGLGGSYGLNKLLVDRERANELKAEGITTLDSTRATTYAMAIPFSIGAGITLGLAKRTGTSGFTTATQVAQAALLSTAAGAVINAGSDKASDYVTGIGMMSAAVGAGALFAVRDEFAHLPVRHAGLAMFGVAAGFALPTLINSAAKIPGEIQRGYEYRPSSGR